MTLGLCASALTLSPSSCPAPGHNACISKPCSLLCLPRSNNGRSCKCPEGVASTVLPSGDLRCDCPHGYTMKNNTCIKEGKVLPGSCWVLRWLQPSQEVSMSCPVLGRRVAPFWEHSLMPARFCCPFYPREHLPAQPVQVLQRELHQQHLAV